MFKKHELVIIGFVIVSMFGILFHLINKEQPNTVIAPRFVKSHDTNVRHSFVGLASWYSKQSPGIKKRTANNEIFDDQLMTCAIWGIPFNQKVKVTNLKNGKSVILRVNDRGPHGRYFRKGRVIDLTKAAFGELSDHKKGLIQVRVDVLNS